MSFAAIVAIVALHENPRARAWFARRDEELAGQDRPRPRRASSSPASPSRSRSIPIALFHFHRAGLYGALANVVAIPLTTFVIMPLEALALLFDLVGLGAPVLVADRPGARLPALARPRRRRRRPAPSPCSPPWRRPPSP